MPLEVPQEIAEDLGIAELEAAVATGVVKGRSEDVSDLLSEGMISVNDAATLIAGGDISPPRRGRGRPPKGKCPNCSAPLAKGRECQACKPQPRPAWEPLPIADLRERLQLLTEAGAESYEDGPIKITLNQHARATRAADKDTGRTRW